MLRLLVALWEAGKDGESTLRVREGAGSSAFDIFLSIWITLGTPISGFGQKEWVKKLRLATNEEISKKEKEEEEEGFCLTMKSPDLVRLLELIVWDVTATG